MRTMNLLLAGGLALVLQGCAHSKCNVLSQSNSKVCDAALGAGMVVAAPIVAPPLAIRGALKGMSKRRAEAHQRKAILAGDIEAMGTCVLLCDIYYTLKGRGELEQISRRQVLARWDAQPEPEQLPVLMVAHYHAGASLLKQDPVQAERHLLRASELAADPRIVAALKSERYGAHAYNNGYYNRVAVDTQGALQVLRYLGEEPHAVPPRDVSSTEKDCVAIAPWPPAWMHDLGASYLGTKLHEACWDIYYHVRESGQSAP